MPESNRLQVARDSYAAFSSGDRDAIEKILAEDLTFSSPPDPGLDRAGYFERCWPHSGRRNAFEFTRLIEAGDEVVVTYVSTSAEGRPFRNTEVLTFDADDRIRTIEVYFGWNLD